MSLTSFRTISLNNLKSLETSLKTTLENQPQNNVFESTLKQSRKTYLKIVFNQPLLCLKTNF